MSSRCAVILAGGLGSRLHPYTITIPKPLVPIGDYPILEIIILQLKDNGFSDIILTVNHQADLIKAYFGDGEKYGVNIRYSLEKKRLGTMGPLSLIEDLPPSFLVMNGDILCDVNYLELFSKHQESRNSFTICSFEREHLIDYGVLHVKDTLLVKLEEKPKKKYSVSTGIYVMDRSLAREMIPQDTYYGFDDLMSQCLADGVRVNVFKHSGLWLDIGRPSDYEAAASIFIESKNNLIKES